MRLLEQRAPGQEAGARLVVRLLGTATVDWDGQPLPDLATPRVQRLLARLALAPGPLRRDLLAWELWPESTDAQARTNLRKLVHDLRRPLPDPDALLDVDLATIGWRVGAPVWVDAAAFVAAAADDPGLAAELYRGDLLPACYDDWVERERQRLRSLAGSALARLAARAEESGDLDAVVAHARRLLRLEPLDEAAHRLLVQALARSGRRGEALAAYRRCVEVLDRELGVDPDPATQALGAALRRPARRAPPAAPPSPLVGREAAWQAARDCWDVAAAGSARLLLVTGEAGIGKTRLVEELAGEVAAEGHAVAQARAYEAASPPPWGPVVDWLRAEAVRPGVAALAEPWRSQLARLLPELRTPSTAPGAPTPGEGGLADRRHLLDATAQALVGPARPLLLVLDDAQWCDAATVELCGFLLEHAPHAPVLLAATARDDDLGALDGSDALTRLRARSARTGSLSSVELGRLDAEQTAAVAAAGGAILTAEDAERLWVETEGNPLFVIEAVRAGFGRRGGAPPSTITPTVQAVITARLRRLTPDARAVLEAAATIGRAFTPDALARVTGRSEEELTPALDELWSRRLIVARASAYDFSHDKLREVALAEISPARRRTLHRAVAGALEAGAEDPGPVSARIAAHHEAAGQDALAVAAYERAAEHAYRVFALDEGIDLLHRALRLLDRAPRGPGRDETELRLRSALGVPLVARHGYGAAAVRHSYDQALRLHRRLDRPPSPEVLRGLALHAVVVCDLDLAADLAARLLDAGATERTARVEGHYVLGVVRYWLGDLVGAERHLRAALAAYRVEDAPRHIARYAQDPRPVCLVRLALNDLLRGRRAAGDRALQEALRLVDEVDHPMTTGYVRAFHATIAALAPEDHDLPAAVDALEAITSTMRIDYFHTIATLLGGWRDVLDGDRRGIDALRAVTDRWTGDQELHLTFGLVLLARAHLRAGEVAPARVAVDTALAATERTGQRYLLAELLRVDAEVHAASGAAAAGAARAREAVRVAAAQGASWLAARAAATAASLPPPPGH